MLDKAVEEFKNYTDKYLYLGSKMTLKVNHTFRVMDLCEKIAKSLDLSDNDIKIAKLCGLLHDIGRFEQYKRFETFKDIDSIDHGDLGVSILKNNNYLRKYIEDDSYDNIILNSIKNHNKLRIDDNLNEKEKLFCKIVRDADKIDILYLYTTNEVYLDTNNEKFTDKVYNNLLEEDEISKNIKLNKADNLSISLGFVFDINFEKSFNILKIKDYYNIIIDKYKSSTNNEEFKDQLENIRIKINNYIKERL